MSIHGIQVAARDHCLNPARAVDRPTGAARYGHMFPGLTPLGTDPGLLMRAGSGGGICDSAAALNRPGAEGDDATEAAEWPFFIPQSFLDMPRWWREGSGWLETLPRLIDAYCARWQLTITGAMTHGSNAAVLPVDRGGDLFVLRLTPPGPEVVAQVAALRFWDGRGTVRLIDADPAGGAMLLERLAIGESLSDVPVAEAIPVLGRMMRRLAIPAPPDVPSTADVVAERMTTLRVDWERLGRPFEEAMLRRAMAVGTGLMRTESMLAVNGDLHSAQVLRGSRERWLTVDPVLMRGDIAFDLARVLWTRIDEMTDIVGHFDAAVEAAGIDREHGRSWVLFRTVDYWLWGLTAGLTEDPERCRRLLGAMAD